MNDAVDAFRIRIGRMRDLGARSQGRSKVFVVQVMRAAMRAGRFDGGAGRSRSQFGRGRGAALAVRLRSPARRVVVQVRVVRHAGRTFRSAPLSLHLAYLRREGVDREGGAGRLFSAGGEADGRAFADRCEDDRHHFRVMVSPEDADQLQDLRATTRELMARAEKDLGTRLDWVAVDHWNTPHPHVHVLIRGRDDQGRDLVISRDYITQGLRARAQALVSLELGPRTAREIASDLQRQVSADRWTPLDRLLSTVAVEGRADLRPGLGAPDPEVRPLLLGRAQRLEALGFAWGEGPGVWRLAADLETRLRELALRGDIVKSLHRAMGEERALAELAPFGEESDRPALGRLVARGLFDEQTGAAFVIIDGVDGRAHHVRLPDLGAAGDTPAGGIVEFAPGRGAARILHRSDLTIEDQVLATGATWLDRRLVARDKTDLSDGGFGVEVAAALEVRAQHLETVGLAKRTAGGWSFARGLLSELRRRELFAAGARLAGETGLAFREGEGETEVRGRYGRRIDLASGRFAMVEDGLGFRLVPWAAVLDRRLGLEVSGRLRDGGVDWDIGRRRDLDR